MYFARGTLALFATSALAAELQNVWTDATSFGAMLARGDTVAKRQGYTPEQRSCGSGSTCQDACGASYLQCPSTDNKMHCHNPTTGTRCCTNGSGSACKTGYYCTTDTRGSTYCCPDGIGNAACAKLYSLTVSLMRETSLTRIRTVSTFQPSVTALTPVLPTHSSRIHVTSTRSSKRTKTRTPSSRATSNRATTTTARSSSRNATSLILPSSKTAVTYVQTSIFPQSTGGAVKLAKAGTAVLAGAICLLL